MAGNSLLKDLSRGGTQSAEEVGANLKQVDYELSERLRGSMRIPSGNISRR